MQLFHDPDVIKCLDISIVLTATGQRVAFDRNDPHAIEEQARLAKFFRFLYEVAAAHSWSQIQFAMFCPQFLAVTWQSSFDVRKDGLLRAKSLWDSMLQAEAVVFEKPHAPQLAKRVKAKVEQCMTDAAWNGLQISREAFSCCRASDWDPAAEEVRLLTHRLFGRPSTTKHFLEDAFAHISDISKRHMKGQTMQRRLVIIILGYLGFD